MDLDSRGDEATNQEKNLQYVGKAVEELARIKPDLVCLTEIFTYAWAKLQDQDLLAGPKLMKELAVKYGTHIVGTVHEERKGRIYNTALVVDRKGNIAGRYDKIHPTESEMESGVVPGAEGQPPVETSFGKIGVQICFDANWPKGWSDLAEAGAKLIVFPSAFPGGKLLESHALLNSVYVVPSTWRLDSGVIDNTGLWRAKTEKPSRWAWARIDLERTVFHLDYQEEKIPAIKSRYGDGIKVESFTPEGWFTLEPADDGVSIPQVMKEFGLVTYRDYIKRAAGAQKKARK